MAENETLNSGGRAALRWKPIKARISSGQPPGDCFADIEKEFYLGFQRFREELEKQREGGRRKIWWRGPIKALASPKAW